MKINNIWSVFICMLAFGCSACKPDIETDTTEAEPSPITWEDCGYNSGDHPCNITLTDQNGEEWDLYDHYGSSFVLDFSTEWCVYCQKAAENTQLIHDDYSDKDLIYVTILIEDSEGNSPPAEGVIENWADYYGITAPVLKGSRDMMDTTGTNGWPITGWPTFYFVNKDMEIYTTLKGYSDTTLLTLIDNMMVDEISSD